MQTKYALDSSFFFKTHQFYTYHDLILFYNDALNFWQHPENLLLIEKLEVLIVFIYNKIWTTNFKSGPNKKKQSPKYTKYFRKENFKEFIWKTEASDTCSRTH